MKIRYICGNDFDVDLINDKEYEVMVIDGNYFRIIDESKEDYLYPPYLFEVVEEDWQTEKERELVKIAKARIEASKQYQLHKKNK